MCLTISYKDSLIPYDKSRIRYKRLGVISRAQWSSPRTGVKYVRGAAPFRGTLYRVGKTYDAKKVTYETGGIDYRCFGFHVYVEPKAVKHGLLARVRVSGFLRRGTYIEGYRSKRCETWKRMKILSIVSV